MAMTRDEAMTELALFTNATEYPTVDSATLGSFLDDYVRFTPWAASTAYSVGDVIVPTVPNGRLYECRTPGTSAATEPQWPYYGSYTGYYTQDGTGTPVLTWVDQGPAHVERYDTRSAARAVWIYKAGLLANQIDTSEGPTDVKLSQLQSHCLAMAERYRPMVVFV